MIDLKTIIRDIPDFPKPGIIFKDITPILLNNKVFNDVIYRLAMHYQNAQISKIASVEARGFIFGSALAYALNTGFIPLRKPNKLPYKRIREEYALEYGTDSIEMHEDAINKGEKILIMDDLLATGGTILAAAKLVEKAGGDIVGIATVIELAFLNGIEKIKKYPYYTLVTF